MTELTTYTFHIGQILKALVYIEDNLDDELSLEKLAFVAKISPFYFHRLFRAYLGVTLADYIKTLRLQRARALLQYTDTPITEIALSFGYESPSAFTKMFQQLMGESPRKYRQTMKPILQEILKRTLPATNTPLKPEYVIGKEEEILFVRKSGDYKITPWQAFGTLQAFLKDKAYSQATFYSIALDDPNIVEREKCRFDAAVNLQPSLTPSGEVGKRILPGGKFAVFTHVGPYSDIELAFQDIFRLWHPTSKDKLREAPDFCQYLDMQTNPEIPTTKIYIPLL